MTQAIQYLVDACSYGTVFALMALALALLFGVMGLMNFAYGELIMVGGYTMVLTRDLPWPLLVLATVAVVTLTSVLMERLAFRPLRHATPLTLLVSSFAVSVALHQVGYIAFPGPPRGIPPYEWLTSTVDIGGVLISRLAIVTAVVTVLLLVATTTLLRRTMLGIQLRASTEDFAMAQLVGVRANRVIVWAFVITGVLAGAAAILFNLRTGSVSPLTGQGPLLIAFVGGVIGGLGSLRGAALGGFVLGAAITLLQAALPASLQGYTILLTFVAVISILVFKPGGLITVNLRRARPDLATPASEGA